MDDTAAYKFVGFLPCGPGTFAFHAATSLQRIACLPCTFSLCLPQYLTRPDAGPFGALVLPPPPLPPFLCPHSLGLQCNGSTPLSNGLAAQRGYWGLHQPDTATVAFFQVLFS